MVFESITCPPDHPRVCGANADERDVSDLVAGSSPRVRGELDGHVLDADDGRIIPACAGRTPATRGHRTRGPDHPRVCGANRMCCSLSMRRAGSSPRVRGELPVGPLGLGWDRIIPACAGRTPSRRSNEPDRPDHPRVCGANYMIANFKDGGHGSSPRVRGERRRHRHHGGGERIIPACAGRTPTSSAPSTHPPDHPRVCGANGVGAGSVAVPVGSSPRVRGELLKRGFGVGDLRIIPACAGRTPSWSESSTTPTDHPRVCGANAFMTLK